jgi:hypothetical protein
VVCQIWRTRQSLIFFQKSNMGCPCAFVAYHVATPDWATWKPLIRPYHPLPCHIHIITHVTVPHHHTDATWHNPIGPQIGLKMPKLGDTWQPMVLPHHHADIMMTSTSHVSPSTPSTCTVRMLIHPLLTWLG